MAVLDQRSQWWVGCWINLRELVRLSICVFLCNYSLLIQLAISQDALWSPVLQFLILSSLIYQLFILRYCMRPFKIYCYFLIWWKAPYFLDIDYLFILVFLYLLFCFNLLNCIFICCVLLSYTFFILFVPSCFVMYSFSFHSNLAAWVLCICSFGWVSWLRAAAILFVRFRVYWLQWHHWWRNTRRWRQLPWIFKEILSRFVFLLAASSNFQLAPYVFLLLINWSSGLVSNGGHCKLNVALFNLGRCTPTCFGIHGEIRLVSQSWRISDPLIPHGPPNGPHSVKSSRTTLITGLSTVSFIIESQSFQSDRLRKSNYLRLVVIALLAS